MTRLFFSIMCLAGTITLSTPESGPNEFVQPKKSRKRPSIDALKKSNIESCSDAFDSTASLVEGLGRCQKRLKKCIDAVVNDDTRAYHEQMEKKLSHATNLLQQMEDLLATCEQCLKSTV